MTTSAVTTTLDHASSMSRAVRNALVAVAVVIVIALAFTVGHLTAASPSGPATTPAQVQASIGTGAGAHCQAGHLSGPC